MRLQVGFISNARRHFTKNVTKGDPIFDYINGLRRSGAIGSAVETEILDVDLFR